MNVKLPKLNFGDDLGKQLKDVPPFAVVTMDPPWSLVQNLLPSKPLDVAFVKDMSVSSLEALEKQVKPCEAVLGIGGGSCIDGAKYIAWRRGIPFIAVPTIVSVDAMVTDKVAIRENGVVRYIGEKIASEVVVNFPLITQAPIHLNRAGIGDVLSIHTALYDWRLAADCGKERYDVAIAQQAESILAELEENLSEIRSVTPQGIEKLVRLFVKANAICYTFGSSRPEEGSEHFFAYNHEYLTKRHYVHGELVCLGIIIMSYVQNNDPKRVLSLIEEAGVRFRPNQIGTSLDEVHRNLATLGSFVQQHGLYYSVIDARFPLEEREIDVILNLIK
ncbi:MAG: iron-containing alcohol dehydrogenase [Deltaproteobacteria bacterium]|nr:iron-containing alcohol dehydrogenase [Deltaproteobacteria bacterium]